VGAFAVGRKLGRGLVIDGARLSAWHWVLMEVPMARVGTARGMPAWCGKRGETW